MSDGRHIPTHAVMWLVVNDRMCKTPHPADAPCSWEPTPNVYRALLQEAFDLCVKPVADAYVTHGEKYWSLRDRIAAALVEGERAPESGAEKE